jgi:hypothetical protein
MSLTLLRHDEEAFSDDEARWAAVAARDRRADGAFYVQVATTGIYCLPSCPGRPLRKNVSFAVSRAAAERAGYRPCKRCRPDRFVAGSLDARLEAIDWRRAEADLDAFGHARLGALLSREECDSLIEGYEGDLYRSTVVMRRHGFGEGEYRYFSDPPPPLVGALRAGLYRRFVPLAEKWAAMLGAPRLYPAAHADYRKRCAANGQTRPTPLILKYGAGDYNRLHQDLYGGEVFPVQVAILLSEPGADFDGGELVLTEQTPRRQSRAEVVALRRGEALAFAVNERPVKGAKGVYRVKTRHGVSTLRSGARFTLGIIFHDAA